jgi:hypothetical protein
LKRGPLKRGPLKRGPLKRGPLARGSLALGVLALAGAAVLALAGPAQAAPIATPTRDVAYHGYHLSVPVGWSVVDLARNPDSCVRFDRHAVYLGRPGADQQCPAHLVGRTEAVVVEPLDGASVGAAHHVSVLSGTAAPAELPSTVDHQETLAVPAAGVLVTGTYADSPAALSTVLRTGRADATATPAVLPAAAPHAVTPAIAATDTNFTGDGFDACAAPSSAAMAAWTSATSYRGIGVYFGGAHRACSQPNLTSSWLTTQVGRGWHFIPIYVGTQASSLGSSAASKGSSEADDAANAAGTLGIPTGSVLYDDMEAYSSTYSSNVLAYLNAWTARLHARGYLSGVYSSAASGVTDLNSHYGASSPDVIYFAHWNNSKTTSDSYLSSGHWANHQRVHQYSGDVNETHGGYTINIDGDWMDVRVAGGSTGPAPVPDWPTVRQGNTGETVRSVQYLLNQAGATLTVDGDFGSATLAAVTSFQSGHSLGVDGIVGPNTWSALAVTVRSGSTGNAVKAVQSQLTAHGYQTTVDGAFGPTTLTNLKAFQTALGTTASGVADATTWRYLVG